MQIPDCVRRLFCNHKWHHIYFESFCSRCNKVVPRERPKQGSSGFDPDKLNWTWRWRQRISRRATCSPNAKR